MSGDDADDGTPKEFNECVGQQQLQAVLEKAREEMTEAVDRAVTDGINRLNLGNQVERLDRRISTLADTVTTSHHINRSGDQVNWQGYRSGEPCEDQ